MRAVSPERGGPSNAVYYKMSGLLRSPPWGGLKQNRTTFVLISPTHVQSLAQNATKYQSQLMNAFIVRHAALTFKSLQKILKLEVKLSRTIQNGDACHSAKRIRIQVRMQHNSSDAFRSLMFGYVKNC
jgi:hypothetical protein